MPDMLDPTRIVGAVVNSSPTLSKISNNISALGGAARSAMNLFGGVKASLGSATAKMVGKDADPADLRVRIKVPASYLTTLTIGGEGANLSTLGGIIFPYTPQITTEYKATYSALTPTHSNTTQYFYQNSSVIPINITGVFTVQNDSDAEIYLATIHLLRALTKMRFGGYDAITNAGDPNSGAPPPVCKLMAYGNYMFDNVPVAIASFKNDLLDNVDYYSVDSLYYGKALVPTKSTIAITCNPMYSRREILNSTVTGWLGGTDAGGREKGYL